MSIVADRAHAVAKFEVAQNVVTTDNAEHGAMLTVDGRGMICDCNHAGEKLFRYRHSELAWQTVALLLPELAQLALMTGGQPNQRLRYLCRIGRRFHGVTKDGERFTCELCLNLIDNSGPCRLSLIVIPVEAASDHQAMEV